MPFLQLYLVFRCKFWLQDNVYLITRNAFYVQQGVCAIAVLYLAVIRSFINI